MSKIKNNLLPRILFLFPPTQKRKDNLFALVQRHEFPERYLFYGMDYFIKKGLSVDSNLNSKFLFGHFIGKNFRRIIQHIGGYPGDIEWILPVFYKMMNNDIIVAFSDRIAFPIAYLRSFGILKRYPICCITVGLPEKLESFRNNRLKKKIVGEFNQYGKLISLSVKELQTLIEKHGIKRSVIDFVPAGVDIDYFRPYDTVIEYDVLSIGADPNRDFETLFKAANSLLNNKFLVVTTKAHANAFTNVPGNVEIMIDIPMSKIRELFAKCRIVAIPVRDNTYSGGTTVMLQAMSMEKAVIANKVGANINGYGFRHGDNCIFVEVGNPEALTSEIYKILTNPEKAQKIGYNARKHVEMNLNLEKFHSKLFKIAKGVLDIKKRACLRD